MHFKYLKSTFQIRETYFHLSIEPSWSNQSIIQYLFSIGSPHYNNLIVCLKSIHLNQQLIQSAFSLIITSKFVHSFFSNCI